MAASILKALETSQVFNESREDLDEEIKGGEDDEEPEEEERGEDEGEDDENEGEGQDDDEKENDEDPAAKSVLLALAEGREKIEEIFAANEDSEE